MKKTESLIRLMLLFVFFALFSINTHAQKVTLSYQNVPFERVLNSIKKQTGLALVFSDQLVDVNRRVSINVKNAEVQSVLRILLSGTNLDFEISNRKLYLVEKKRPKEVSDNNKILIGKKTITGSITDVITNEPLIGASVIEAGTTNGVITDVNGVYNISVKTQNPTLVFSYIGYNEQTIVANTSIVNVRLQESDKQLEEIVVVGYGTQKRQSVTGAVSQMSGTELLKAPVGNLNNLLAGRISGVVSLQTSGQPGADGAGMLVRGGAAKYIVDGFERSFSEIDPNEIETVSVLKDASSASVYGLDAGSVIIITTKRGKKEASKITFNGGYGISQNTHMMKMLDGLGYAYWYNRATEMDGNTPVFTSEHLKKMKEGVDGWGNTNWYKETFGTGNTRNLNMNATGGIDNIKYFVSLGNYNQQGNIKNFDYNRYNFRSNIDAIIAHNLDISVDISTQIQDRNAPLFGASDRDFNSIPQQAIRAHPYVPKEIDGIPVSTRAASVFVNPLASSNLSGYNKANTSALQTNLALNFRVPYVKGLSLKLVGSYDLSYRTTKRFSTPYDTYVANIPTSTTKTISYSFSKDSRGDEASLVEGLSKSTYLRTNTSIKYENNFGAHNLTALLLSETSIKNNNSFGAYGYGFDVFELDELDFNNDPTKTKVIGGSNQAKLAGFLGRITYDYTEKYLLETSLRYDGSYVFGGMVPGKRWSPFPAASLGWRISEEEWFKQSINFVNNLKLRGAIGLTGRTGIDPYYFLSTLSPMDGPAVVLGGEAVQGFTTSRPGNVNLSWEKTLQYNMGFDATLWRGLLGIEFDFFYKYNYDVLVATSQIPDSWGGYRPGYENIGKKDQKGFDFTLTHRNKIGSANYRIGVTGSYVKRRWLSYPDAPNTPDWLKLTGKPEGSQVGFLADGLFQSQEEIDKAAIIEAARPVVGDIRYIDRNGDGVISFAQDRGYVGKSAYPNFVGGFTFDINWKGIDFSTLLQTGLDRDVALTGLYSTGVMSNTSMTRPFYGNGNSPVYLVENSWTEENRNAEFPRLTVTPASGNNAYASTFWYRNGNYLRIKNAQIGYTFPKQWTEYLKMNEFRLYIEGQNLLTFSQLTKYAIDPEQPGVSNGYYPQQRVFNFGIKLSF